MEQDLFNFDAPETPSGTPSDVDPIYRWNWWDAWPVHLTEREQHMWQIKRDRRALLEDHVTPDEQQFYARRIAAHRQALEALC